MNGICQQLINQCFDNLKMRRVKFKIDSKNVKPQKAIEKVGAIREGLLTNYNLQSYGPGEGTYIYSIIQEDWQNPNCSATS